MPRRLTTKEIERVLELRKEGVSYQAIGKSLDPPRSISTIEYVHKKWQGVEIMERHPLSSEEKRLIVELRKKGFSYGAIAKKVNRSTGTVANVAVANDLAPISMLKRYHIEILDRERAMGKLDVEPMNEYKIEAQNKLGDEITDILWEVRSLLFEL